MLGSSKAFSGFSVDDLKQAKEFYKDILGLEVVELEMGHLELRISDGGRIIVYPKPNHTPASFTILNFPVDNIEATVNGLIRRGIIFEQYGGEIQTDEKGICRNSRGPAIAWFKDPAGNILSVLEPK